ncbi:MAG: hypothetical protein ABWY19_09790 [Marmoricola sp.]
MGGLLAHAVHYLLVVLGLAGVAWLLLPQVHAVARGSRRTTFRPPATPSEHEERVAALRTAVENRSLTSPAESAGSRPTARDSSLWRVLAVTSSVAAAGVHAAVFPHHLDESTVVGTFFLAVTLAQAAWACLMTLDATDDRLLLAGILGSLGLVALWAFSRTVGVSWLGLGREGVGAWDVASGIWELVVVAGCLVGLRRPRSERALVMGDLGRLAWAWVLTSGVVLVVLTLTVSHN